MSEIFGQHRQDLNEVRRLCLICHGLDLTSDKLFSDSTYDERLDVTRGVFQNLVSSSLLSLAVSIRINLYQDNLKNSNDVDLSGCGIFYEHQEMRTKPFMIKHVCDKIIHADEIYKEASPSRIFSESKLLTQFKGKYNGKGWTMDLSIEHFTEAVLNYMDKLELSKSV